MPTLLILSNPARIPLEAQARKTWARFHLKAGNNAHVQEIPDIPGMPKTVVVLGACEEIAVCAERWGRSKLYEFGRSHENGPWLVMDVAGKKLSIVSQDDALDEVPDDGYVERIVYHPGKSSGKADPRAFSHTFGEGGSLQRRDWPNAYPALRWVDDHAVSLSKPAKFSYVVEGRGIVG